MNNNDINSHDQLVNAIFNEMAKQKTEQMRVGSALYRFEGKTGEELKREKEAFKKALNTWKITAQKVYGDLTLLYPQNALYSDAIDHALKNYDKKIQDGAKKPKLELPDYNDYYKAQKLLPH